MANQEKDTTSGGHEQFDNKQLEKAGDSQRELIRENLERGPERTPETSIESARQEALDQASSHERVTTRERAKDNPERKRTVITKEEKKQSFNTTMQEVRSQMSPASRAFSKVIHQPVVEKASDFVGNTIARPNAILSGSLAAFLFTAALYLIARFNGYPLSGSEAIAAFIAGWLIGIVFDYFRVLLLGKK